MYGATGAEEPKTFFVPGKRRRLNCVGFLIGLLTGPVVFTYVLTLMCSEYRFHNPTTAKLWYSIAVVGTLFQFAFTRSYRVKDREPMWLGFITTSLILANIMGVGAGDYIFETYTVPFYDMTSLNNYPDINPSSQKGDAFLDAGFLYFSDGTELEFNMPGQYRHGDLYCVVPIINREQNGGVPETGSYDFWAVGKNCCGDPVGVFRCGRDYANKLARSGLREIDLKDHDQYLHAVEQATVTYGIKSDYPVLVQWVQNPLDVVLQFMIDGLEVYRLWLGGFFLLNSMLAFVAMLFFSRIGKLGWDEAPRPGDEAAGIFDIEE
jgi:hypothetical protein